MLEPSTYSTETWSFLFKCVWNLLELEKRLPLPKKAMISHSVPFLIEGWEVKKAQKFSLPLLA